MREAGVQIPFRAHARRRVRLDVTVEDPVTGQARAARMLDASLGGACLELEHEHDRALHPGGHLVVTITTPALWDPLRVSARVAWTEAVARPDEGRRVRAGVAFEHDGPDAVLSTWEMLASLVDA